MLIKILFPVSISVSDCTVGPHLYFLPLCRSHSPDTHQALVLGQAVLDTGAREMGGSSNQKGRL